MRYRTASTVLLALLTWGSHLDAQQPPRFRSGIEVVSVNVSVRNGNTPVTGLTAADFHITDSGVPQAITRVDFEAVPVDVTLVLDASGSTAWVVEKFKKDTLEIAGL